MMRLASLLLTALLLCGSATPGFADIPSQPVFQAGKDGYKVFRIPALIRAGNGDLLAFCEARAGGDASEIDLVSKRSSDGGKTWGALQVVQESEEFASLFTGKAPEITVGNPSPVVDSMDREHPGRIWMLFTLENDRVFVIFSDDHGASWSQRREITEEVKLDDWGWYATGPVHGIQIQAGRYRGRLVIAADHRIGESGEDRGANGAQVIYSDDHGEHWKLGAVDDTYEDGINANETTVVELDGGTLYFNTRDQHGAAPGTRGEAWSDDGGLTFHSPSEQWKQFQPVTAVLDPPVVQCALLRAGDLILFSGPDNNGPSGEGRSDLRLRYSPDQAQSWHDGMLVHTGPAAYSDMAHIDEGHVGVLFEAGEKSPYETIRFAVIERASIRPPAR